MFINEFINRNRLPYIRKVIMSTIDLNDSRIFNDNVIDKYYTDTLSLNVDKVREIMSELRTGIVCYNIINNKFEIYLSFKNFSRCHEINKVINKGTVFNCELCNHDDVDIITRKYMNLLYHLEKYNNTNHKMYTLFKKYTLYVEQGDW